MFLHSGRKLASHALILRRAMSATPNPAALAANTFKGQVVFVTGGGSGINLAIATEFAKLGASVGICGRTAERLDTARSSIEAAAPDAQVITRVADVRDYDALAAALDATQQEAGAPVSTLVAGAAGNFLCPAHKMSPNAFRTVVEIDLLGTFHACHAAFAQLRESKGSIVAVGAGQAFQPFHMQAHVGAAKAGVDNLMANLALEWGPLGIRANTVCPGPIAGTEGMDRLGPPPGSEAYQKLLAAIPAGRYGQATEVAAAATFLASPAASYITGTVLRVDGGMALPGSGQFGATMAEFMKAAKSEK